MKTVTNVKYFFIISLLGVLVANIYSMESVDPKQFESVLLQKENKNIFNMVKKVRLAIAGKGSEMKKAILKSALPDLDSRGSRDDFYFSLFKNNKDPNLLAIGDEIILKTDLKDIFAHVEKFVTLLIERAEISDEIDLLKKQDKTLSRNQKIEALRKNRAYKIDSEIVMLADKINAIVGIKPLLFNKDALNKLIDIYIESV